MSSVPNAKISQRNNGVVLFEISTYTFAITNIISQLLIVANEDVTN